MKWPGHGRCWMAGTLAAVLVLGCDAVSPTDGDTVFDVRGDEVAVDVDPPGCMDRGQEGATATCLLPRQDSQHYITQGMKYFDTLDGDADPTSIPTYSVRVVRWEWPPWLKLTGYGRQDMIDIGNLLRQVDPSTVPERDCRAFTVQPFGRCRVVMYYEGLPCPIYEEFTFNDQGEVTFIEAWSDAPGMHPADDPNDSWAEGQDVRRLSTKVPGLGNATGLIDLDAEWMTRAAARDPDIADLVTRARDFWATWYEELQAAGDDMYHRGCGW